MKLKSDTKVLSNYTCNFKNSVDRYRCVSFITVHHYERSYYIKFCFYHNHDINYEKLQLDEGVKFKIVSLLKKKVKISEIYKDMDKEFPSPDMRGFYITKDYIRYLKNRFCSFFPGQHDVESFVNLSNFNIKSGLITEIYRHMPGDGIVNQNIVDRDFVFCFTTNYQLKMLEKYGNNVLMADSTFGTNKYNYILIFFYVVNEAMFGIPVFQIISSRENSGIIKECLEKLNTQISFSFSPSWLMTDLANCYNNAFKSIWKGEYRWVWCDYHVKKALNKGIQRYIKGEDMRLIVKEKLKNLDKCTTKEEFQNDLQTLGNYFEEYCSNFFDYFKSYYMPKYMHWGLVYTEDCPVNTNMKVEAGFGVFKNQLLERNVHNRIDVLFSKILEFVEDSEIKIIKETSSNKSSFKSSKQKEIILHHKKIEEMAQEKYTVSTRHEHFR